jgi:hypothetical protein
MLIASRNDKNRDANRECLCFFALDGFRKGQERERIGENKKQLNEP